MTSERIIRIMAGVMILLSLALLHFSGQTSLTEPTWLWLTAFIGINLLQSGFTGFCPPELLMKWFGIKSGGPCCG